MAEDSLSAAAAAAADVRSALDVLNKKMQIASALGIAVKITETGIVCGANGGSHATLVVTLRLQRNL